MPAEKKYVFFSRPIVLQSLRLDSTFGAGLYSVRFLPRKVEDLNRELKEMRALVEELHSALRAEQTEKSNLQVMGSCKTHDRIDCSEGFLLLVTLNRQAAYGTTDIKHACVLHSFAA